MLKYSRNQTQLQKGKILGTVDLGLAFITCDSTNKRIDIDGEHHVYHLKVGGATCGWSHVSHDSSVIDNSIRSRLHEVKLFHTVSDEKLEGNPAFEADGQHLSVVEVRSPEGW